MPRLVVDATSENLGPMLDFIENGVVGNSVFDQKLIKMIRLVAEEILANIVNYAYPEEKGTGTSSTRSFLSFCGVCTNIS